MKNRIGIVGGGQLGRMLGFAAKRLGFYVTVLDPTHNSPAGQVVDGQIVASQKNAIAIKQLAKVSDFLTFEIELANSNILEKLSKSDFLINPSPHTLTLIKDKLAQKNFLNMSQIPVAPFFEVNNREDIQKAARKFGYPLVLKARFDGYDGRGNALIKNKKQIDEGLKKLQGNKLYVEKFVWFERELAVMVARSIGGEIKVYPVVETIHRNNICHLVIAPAQVSNPVQKKAQKLAIKMMQHLKGAGVFGIEMFLTKKKEVLINEIAPRVHNSGHYTQEACVTSQFEQHIRAITGLPLGSTDMITPAAVMINILGEREGSLNIEGLDNVLKIPNVSVHIYGKHETKIERKMGHITVIDKTIQKAYKKAILARKSLSI